MAKKGQTFNQYTEEFKLAAVQEYMKGLKGFCADRNDTNVIKWNFHVIIS